MTLIDFQTDPSRYRHWKLATDGAIATLTLDVDPAGGLYLGTELKLNSYDLGVDIELADAVQRLCFEHPEVRAVILRSGKDNVFCAGANIGALAKSAHGDKVNFCKFTNETRLAIEDASANSGQRYLAAVLAATSDRPAGAEGIALPPLEREIGDSAAIYPHLRVALDRAKRRAEITVFGPTHVPGAAGIHHEGAAFWPLAVARELDDAILHLRANEPELGIIVFRSEGELSKVAAMDTLLDECAEDWFVREIRLYWKRVLKRIDMTSRSLFTLIEPGSCFAGILAELVFAADRALMFAGTRAGDNREPATLALSSLNFGAFPMGNGLSRLATRFLGEPESLERARKAVYEPLSAEDVEQLGLVTAAYDEIEWDDEVRL